jgi:uncharacterized membrane protein
MGPSLTLVLGALAAAVVAALLIREPPLDASLGLAVAPWAVAAGLLHAVRHTEASQAAWAGLLDWPTILPLAVAAVGSAWLACSLAPGGRGSVRTSSLLASMGYGVAVPPLLLALARLSRTSGASIGPVILVLAVAGAAAVGLVIGITRLAPDALTVLGSGTALVLGGHSLDAVAAVVLAEPAAIDPIGMEAAMSIVGPGGAVPAYLLGRALVAVGCVLLLTAWGRRHETAHVAAVVAGAPALASGVHLATLAATGLA